MRCSSWCRCMCSLPQRLYPANDFQPLFLRKQRCQWRRLPQLVAPLIRCHRQTPVALLQDAHPLIQEFVATRVDRLLPSIQCRNCTLHKMRVLLDQTHSFHVHQQALVILSPMTVQVLRRGRLHCVGLRRCQQRDIGHEPERRHYREVRAHGRRWLASFNGLKGSTRNADPPGQLNSTYSASLTSGLQPCAELCKELTLQWVGFEHDRGQWYGRNYMHQAIR